MTLIRHNSDLLPVNYWRNIMDDFFGDDTLNFPPRWLSGSANATFPAVNIRETDNEFQLEVAAPGLRKGDLKIEAEDGILHISSEKEEKSDKKDEKGNYTRREFSYRSFSRSFTLPENVASDNISARYSDGVVEIILPKKQMKKEKPARVIEIA